MGLEMVVMISEMSRARFINAAATVAKAMVVRGSKVNPWRQPWTTK